MIDISKRQGTFTVYLREGAVFEDDQLFLQIQWLFKDSIVVNAMAMPNFDCINYVVCNAQFRELRPKENVPYYEPSFIVDKKNNQVTDVLWKEVKPMEENKNEIRPN